jgi:L-ascorbate metabolism protein UlaG (beta-lactamase superfamily)
MILKDPATGKDTSYAADEPAGWIIQLENGFKIYHMGDTGLFGDMKFIGEYYKPDLALVPIGGHYVLDPKDAAYAMKELVKPKMACPCTTPATPSSRARRLNSRKRWARRRSR